MSDDFKRGFQVNLSPFNNWFNSFALWYASLERCSILKEKGYRTIV